MNDPIKRSAAEFYAENIVKVPALLHFTKDQGFLNFNLAFANFEIIAAHLLKSDEWIYGIYYGSNYFGYIYQGEKLSLDQQFACVRDFLPLDRNLLQLKVNEWAQKVDYHKSGTDAFAILGEYDGKPVIRKPKNINDNLNTSYL